MKKIFAAVATTLLLVFSLQVQAQGTETPQLDRRYEDARARVDQGFRNGSLTRGEYDRLSRDLDRVRRMRSDARANGRVTDLERSEIRSELGRIEADIDRLTQNYNRRR